MLAVKKGNWWDITSEGGVKLQVNMLVHKQHKEGNKEGRR